MNGVSLVICCHNSLGKLPKTLEHICNQQFIADISWELIIVDNASTDGTYQLALDLTQNAAYEHRVVRENSLGLKNARMKGIAESKYEFISFLDDDNWVCPQWVQLAHEIMSSKHNVGACGGSSIAAFDTPPPIWFESVQSSFAVGRQCDVSGYVPRSRGYLWGSGLTVRRTAYNNLLIRGFNFLLCGREGNALSSGEDTELCYALRLNGWKLWYEESLKLVHYIPESRLTTNYVHRLYRAFGYAAMVLDSYNYLLQNSFNNEYVTFKEFLSFWINSVIESTAFLNKHRHPSESEVDYSVDDISSIYEEYEIGKAISYVSSFNKIYNYFDSINNLNFIKILLPPVNKETPPKITIVTPSFNQAQYLEECIVSILNQNYPNLEYIIMDGGSTDGSVDIIKKYEKHLAYWQSQHDGGQYEAINAGFQRSTGDIMGWLNSDDKLHPDGLKIICDVFSNLPQVEFLTGNRIGFDEHSNLRSYGFEKQLWSRATLLQKEIIHQHELFVMQEATYWRRSLWDRAGATLDFGFALAGDFELWLRFSRYAQLHTVDALIGGFRYYSTEQRCNKFRTEYLNECDTIIDREQALGIPPHSFYEIPPSLIHYPIPMSSQVTVIQKNEVPPHLSITMANFQDFTYAKKSHFAYFKDNDVDLFNHKVDPNFCNLKAYQDLLVFTFLKENIPFGSRILDIGGGDSRILNHFKDTYECWNIDKLEGVGNGPLSVTHDGYHLVRDYIGNFNDELPENYFDFIFSISTLEHVPSGKDANKELYMNICLDIDRVLKPGGMSLHCFDITLSSGRCWTNDFVTFMAGYFSITNLITPISEIAKDTETYVISERFFKDKWAPLVNWKYEEGKPSSQNLLWKKSIDPTLIDICETIGNNTKFQIVKNNYPMISVVTPSFNQGKYIEQTIQSVLAQKYPKFEHIVIDAGSTDETIEILEKYPHLIWVSEKDSGQTDALNKGFRRATGDIIAWINSDDYYIEGAFENVASFFLKNQQQHVLIGDCLFTYCDLRTDHYVINKTLSFEEIIRYWDEWIPPTQPSIFFRSELFKEFGYFDETLHLAMDYDFWLRIAQKYRFNYLPVCLAAYRFHSASKSSLGNDWQHFYPEWHKVYTRYKSSSQLIGNTDKLLTIALPLLSTELYKSIEHLHVVQEIISKVDRQIIKDTEILVVTDIENASEIIDSGDLSVNIHFELLKDLNAESFAAAVKKQSRGFAFHCPPLIRDLPTEWYINALDSLIDNQKLAFIKNENFFCPHLFSTDSDYIASNKLFRVNSICANNSAEKISVIIPTYNRREKLQHTLKCFNEQTLPASSFEVIVCNDGSVDSTEQMLSAFKPNYHLQCLSQTNSGAATARNKSIRTARGKYILFLNDDIYPSAALLEEHLNFHLNSRDPYSVLLGRVEFDRKHSALLISRALIEHDLHFPQQRSQEGVPYDFDHFVTGNISLSASAFADDSNLFDQGFPNCYCEDIELGYRLWKQGYRVYYNPRALGFHDHRITIDDDIRREKANTRNLLLFVDKHPELSQRYLGVKSISGIPGDEYEKEYQESKPLIDNLTELLRNHQNDTNTHGADVDSYADGLKKVRNWVKKAAIIQELKMKSATNAPLVSVIIPCYNYAHYLPEAVASVIKQTFQNFEIIIVNDGSTDNTVEVAEKLISRFSNHAIKLISTANSGNPAFPRNRGVKDSNGKYILFLDADDKIMPAFLEECLNLLESADDVSIAYTDHILFDETTSTRIHTVPKYDFSKLVIENQLGYCSLFKKKAWEDVGGVSTEVGYEDWDFWIMCGDKGHYGRRIPKPLFCYRQHETGRFKNDLVVRDNLLKAQLVRKHQKYFSRETVDTACEILRSTDDQWLPNMTKKSEPHMNERAFPTNSITGQRLQQHQYIRPRNTAVVFYGFRITPMPNLGIGYLVANLRKHGFNWNYQFFDMVEDISVIAQAICSCRPSIVGLSATSSDFSKVIALSSMIKLDYNPIILLGGAHITSVPQTLPKSVDIGVLGEAEETIIDLFTVISSNTLNDENLRKIDGIAFHDSDGNLVINKRRPFPKDLDTFPRPARDIYVDDYFQSVTSLLTSRGCPYHCAFCQVSAEWRVCRYHSAQYVVDEIVEIVTRHPGVTTFGIIDDLFVVNKKRILEITALLKKVGLHGKLSFAVNGRANLITDELVESLIDMGVAEIALGLESMSPRILSILKDKVTVEDNIRAIETIHRHGIRAGGLYMIGTPTETLEDIEATFNFVQDNRHKIGGMQVCVTTPLPNTALWDMSVERGLINPDLSIFDWNKLNIAAENIETNFYVGDFSVQDFNRILAKFRRLFFEPPPYQRDAFIEVGRNEQQKFNAGYYPAEDSDRGKVAWTSGKLVAELTTYGGENNLLMEFISGRTAADPVQPYSVSFTFLKKDTATIIHSASYSVQPNSWHSLSVDLPFSLPPDLRILLEVDSDSYLAEDVQPPRRQGIAIRTIVLRRKETLREGLEMPVKTQSPRELVAPGPEKCTPENLPVSFCIITNGKRPEKLKCELESIQALNIPEYEILIAGELPQGWSAEGFTYYPLPDAAHNGRLGEMRNFLCNNARYENLVVVDDDMIFHDDFYTGLLTFGPEYDLLAVRLLNPDGTRYWDWAMSSGDDGELSHCLLEYDHSDPDVYVTGGLCVIRKNIAQTVRWDDVRGFYQQEDVDFSNRLKAAGYSIKFCRHSTVTHDDPRYTQLESIVVLEADIEKHREASLPLLSDQISTGVTCSGFHAMGPEGMRWLSRSGTITIAPDILHEDCIVAFSLTCSAAEHYDRFPFEVIITEQLRFARVPFEFSGQSHRLSFNISMSEQPIVFTLESQAYFVPNQAKISPDIRQLSIALNNFSIEPADPSYNIQNITIIGGN